MQQVLTPKQFAKALDKIAALTTQREALLYSRVVAHVELSATLGSAITGAPGVPVRSGDLLRSYRRVGTEAERNVAIVSNSPYAHVIEHNRRGAVLRSRVGGFHSLKITRLNFRLIVQYELPMVIKAIPLSA